MGEVGWGAIFPPLMPRGMKVGSCSLNFPFGSK